MGAVSGGSAWQEGANYPSAELDFTVYINSNVSVYETDFSKGIKLYPNPSKDIVTVDVGKNVTTGTLDLYNLLYSLGIMFLLLIIGVRMFNRVEKNFMDVI